MVKQEEDDFADSPPKKLQMVKQEEDDFAADVPPKKKSKRGGSTVFQMSFDAIVDPLSQTQHTLILGTFPSEKSQNWGEKLVSDKTNQLLKKAKAKSLSSLPKAKQDEISESANLYAEAEIFKRGGEGQMNYGNFKNPFWNIAGIALGFKRELTTYEDKKAALTTNGYCLWDVCKSVTKKKGSSLDNDINHRCVLGFWVPFTRHSIPFYSILFHSIDPSPPPPLLPPFK